MKNKKVYRLVLIIILILVISAIAAFSYAYIRKTKTQESVNEVGTLTCLDISYEDKTSAISLTNALPVDDLDGLNNTPYKFTITNNCTLPVSLKINLESLNIENKLDIAYLNYSINEENAEKESKTLSSATASTATISGATSKRIKIVPLKSLESKTFELRLWVKNTTTWEQGGNKSYSGKIVINADALNYNPTAPDSWNSYQNGTLLAAIRDNGYNFFAPLTKPGSEISAVDESVIASTADDYGTSYYFRGVFDNNYVELANKCWRIVRVDGADNVKLVLANDNTSGASNPCSASNLTSNSGYARYSGSTFTTAFNSSSVDNAYVGFMYGTADSSTYAATHANINKSTFLQNLEKWYNLENNNLKNYDSYIADVIWCNDKSTSGLGYGKNSSSYSFAKRSSNPTLICPDDQRGGNLSRFTVETTGINDGIGNGDLDYKVGLLTADEIAFAGGKNQEGNTFYYINQNATTNGWWSLSPGYFNETYSVDWSVSSSGYLVNIYTYVVTKSYGVRPAISLLATSLVESGGDGTTENPFVISLPPQA